MPYLTEERKSLLSLDPMQAKDAGDYNYLYTITYLKEFIKNPRYATIALIRKASFYSPVIESVDKLTGQLLDLGVNRHDLHAASELAFLEFYHRIGRLYEDYAIEKNGDVKEFGEAEEVVNDLLDKHLSSL